jgi:GrpB-like predicted nucleotidyltransferase (UPF0157 family)
MGDADVEWFSLPIDEAVVISDASERWAELGRQWEARLRHALSPLPTQVDHVGSTAVPGLAAKPVIDMQVQVPDLDDESAYLPALMDLGMALRARGTDFRFLRPPAGGPQQIHVHVCGTDSAWATEHLAFRDALRADPVLAEEYEGIKRGLAMTIVERADYNRGKESFIREVVSRRTSS